MSITVILIQICALALAIIPHEVAHGYVAYRLGDPTAKMARRLTLNPLAHIDLFGSLLLPLILVAVGSPVLFGWAKPVPVDPGYFRNPLRGMMLVGSAGPAINFILAVLSGGLCLLIGPAGGFLTMFLAFWCVTNVVLALFNLIPIPPLDGSRIVVGLLPHNLVFHYLRYERFGFILVFILLWLGVFDYVINPPAHFLFRLLLGNS